MKTHMYMCSRYQKIHAIDLNATQYYNTTMTSIQFDGQQTGERILYTITPHKFSHYVAIAKLFFLCAFFFTFILFIASTVTVLSQTMQLGGFILAVLTFLGGLWWNTRVYSLSKTYITDRRIIRFDVVSPFFQTKRALFWNEALKAKGFASNMLSRSLGIGTVEVQPHLSDHESVKVSDVYLFEDIANYIDKIIYTFNNQRSEVANLKPFVPKPRGQRDA